MSKTPEPADHLPDDDWIYPPAESATGEEKALSNDRYLRWLSAYVETGSVTEAARRAGYSGTDDTLRVQGYRIKRRLRDPLRALMRAEGITAPLILRGLKAGFQATKVQRIKMKEAVVVTDDKGEEHQSIQDVVQEYEDIDFPTRHRYLTTAATMYGILGRNYRGAGTMEAVVKGDEGGAVTAFVGVEAEDDVLAEEEQERQTQSEAELRSDINEIKRKLRLIGYELTPIASAGGED